MNTNSYWENFLESGTVDDYLSYVKNNSDRECAVKNETEYSGDNN